MSKQKLLTTLEDIRDIAIDYDGFRSAKSLMELIDDLRGMASKAVAAEAPIKPRIQFEATMLGDKPIIPDDVPTEFTKVSVEFERPVPLVRFLEALRDIGVYSSLVIDEE